MILAMDVSASASKNSINTAIDDVGMHLSSHTLKSLNSIKKIQPRIMVATFNGTMIISCYCLTNTSDETDLDTFYNELSFLVRSIPKNNVFIIRGDMNAQIGKNINNNFSLYKSSNTNEEHLTDFILENRLTRLNTKFQKRKRKLWTYIYTNNAKAQIDYILKN